MTRQQRTYLISALALLAALVGYLAMAVANLLVWHPARPLGYPAFLTGLPWFWPGAPGRFLLYNQPVWGLGAALAYGLVWRWCRGRTLWRRVAFLWAAMSAAIGILGLMFRDGLIGGDKATIAALGLYGLVGLFAVRDWVARP